MIIRLLELTVALKRKPPATIESIQITQNSLGIKLPEDYIEWMLISNGGSGSIGSNSYLVLWSIEQIIPLNKAHQVSMFAPGLILFGSDGGGEGYAFDTQSEMLPIVQVPFVGMNIESAKVRGNSFLEFLNFLWNY